SRAGSLRRMYKTVTHIDFIVATNVPDKVRDSVLKMKQTKREHAKTDTKVSITSADRSHVNVDDSPVNSQAFATRLHTFTGANEHNVKMRQLATSRGEKSNEYGVEIEETGEILTFPDEKGFFNHFDLHYIPPEIREDTGEVEAASQESIELIEIDDIQG